MNINILSANFNIILLNKEFYLLLYIIYYLMSVGKCVLWFNYAESYHWNVHAASLSYVSIYYISFAMRSCSSVLYMYLDIEL